MFESSVRPGHVQHSEEFINKFLKKIRIKQKRYKSVNQKRTNYHRGNQVMSSKASRPKFKLEVLYTDEEADMSGLPVWIPDEPVDNTAYTALFTSIGLLLFFLGIPMIAATLFGRYTGAHQPKEAEKPMAEDLSQLDDIYDPDGEYRDSKFDGMLDEDAADDVEIPSDPLETAKMAGESESKSKALQKRSVATQTDLSYLSDAHGVFERYDVQGTMDYQESTQWEDKVAEKSAKDQRQRR
ncbi:unnamed protein product [Cylicocyclus nassatus]|uniref:Uncharacterized protein n=1 Tax=Cylicocyclus nassatus TaxID=53992 RepID=A0AA36DMN4_CYLNA|nr:unnamed protein product [Cylicocyclus nassatus]